MLGVEENRLKDVTEEETMLELAFKMKADGLENLRLWFLLNNEMKYQMHIHFIVE